MGRDANDWGWLRLPNVDAWFAAAKAQPLTMASVALPLPLLPQLDTFPEVHNLQCGLLHRLFWDSLSAKVNTTKHTTTKLRQFITDALLVLNHTDTSDLGSTKDPATCTYLFALNSPATKKWLKPDSFHFQVFQSAAYKPDICRDWEIFQHTTKRELRVLKQGLVECQEDADDEPDDDTMMGENMFSPAPPPRTIDSFTYTGTTKKVDRRLFDSTPKRRRSAVDDDPMTPRRGKCGKAKTDDNVIDVDLSDEPDEPEDSGDPFAQHKLSGTYDPPTYVTPETLRLQSQPSLAAGTLTSGDVTLRDVCFFDAGQDAKKASGKDDTEAHRGYSYEAIKAGAATTREHFIQIYGAMAPAQPKLFKLNFTKGGTR